MEASSNKITAGASSSRIRFAAAKLATEATRSPAIRASNSRRAAAHNAASSLTTNIVCFLLPKPSSISCCVLSCHFCGPPLMVVSNRQHTVNLFRQLFHAERFGDVRQVVTFQELPRLRGNRIAGHEKEPLSQRISGALQRCVEVLPIEPGHLHIADDQVEGLPGRAVEGFAAVQQHLYMHPLFFEHVGD